MKSAMLALALMLTTSLAQASLVNCPVKDFKQLKELAKSHDLKITFSPLTVKPNAQEAEVPGDAKFSGTLQLKNTSPSPVQSTGFTVSEIKVSWENNYSIEFLAKNSPSISSFTRHLINFRDMKATDGFVLECRPKAASLRKIIDLTLELNDPPVPKCAVDV